jgi:hypothetical protein
MANETKSQTAVTKASGSSNGTTDARAIKRQATRDLQRSNRGGRDLTKEESLWLTQLSLAGRVCEALADRIRNGRPVDMQSMNYAKELSGKSTV